MGLGGDGDPEKVRLRLCQSFQQQPADVLYSAQGLASRSLGVGGNPHTPEVVQRAPHLLGGLLHLVAQTLDKTRQAAVEVEGDALQALQPADGAKMGLHTLAVERAAQDGSLKHGARHLGQGKEVAEHLAEHAIVAGTEVRAPALQVGLHLAQHLVGGAFDHLLDGVALRVADAPAPVVAGLHPYGLD